MWCFITFEKYKIFEIQCIFYIYSTSHFGPTISQMYNGHMWLEAIIVDRAALVIGTQAVVSYSRKSQKEEHTLPIAQNMDVKAGAKTATTGHEISS